MRIIYLGEIGLLIHAGQGNIYEVRILISQTSYV